MSCLEELQAKLNISFPEYLINLLKYTGFDNVISLSALEDEDINEIERFGRNDLFKIVKTNTAMYFGIYHNDIDNFRIVIGHRKLLLEIAKAAKEINLKRKIDDELTLSVKKRKRHFQPAPNGCDNDLDVSTIAASQGESSWDETIPLVDVNIEKEMSDIEALLKNWTRNYFVLTLSNTEYDEYLNKMDTIHIMVDVEDNSLVAQVKCILCYKTIKLLKYKNRWYTSNFNKHLKLHFRNRNNSMQSSSMSPFSSAGDHNTIDLAVPSVPPRHVTFCDVPQIINDIQRQVTFSGVAEMISDVVIKQEHI